MTADEIKQLLQLQPLSIEGGFFRETYRSRWAYYMLTPETFSALHRLPGTEVFHFYLGDPVVMLQLLPDGSSRTITLGSDLLNGQQPQVVVRGQVWQGSRLAPGGKLALMGTTMSPGFDYADYETADREQLIAQYPGAASRITEYTT
jgi:hypothetical protein